MIKSQLIQRIAAKNPHLFERDIERIMNIILARIVEAMARGDRVELRSFGTFSVRVREAHEGRNPRTGEAVAVARTGLPYFKTGKEMGRRLNRKPDEGQAS